MNYQKGSALTIIIIIFAIIAVLAIGGMYLYDKGVFGICNDCGGKWFPPEFYQPNSTTTPIVGGDKDEHGCLGSAGYSWCAVKNKCLRVWEEKCEGTPINSGPGDKDGVVACTMDAMMCPNGTYVGRTGPKCEFVCPNN
jgi:hypothetical protein